MKHGSMVEFFGSLHVEEFAEGGVRLKRYLLYILDKNDCLSLKIFKVLFVTFKNYRDYNPNVSDNIVNLPYIEGSYITSERTLICPLGSVLRNSASCGLYIH